MRVIGGQWKGRHFHPPRLSPTRPTTDIAKEGLMNILNHYFHFEECSALDLFAGTGGISLEWLSRGCTPVVSIDQFAGSIQFMNSIKKEWDIPQWTIRKEDVFRFLKNNQQSFDLIFAGPPYPLPQIPDIPDLIFHHQTLANPGWLILEHNPNHQFTDHPRFILSRNYGTTIFSIFSHSPLP